MVITNVIKESFLFAFNALVVNKLRTFLSLLGITIGIFAIISVFTIVDSLEKNIRESVASLGENVIFIQKWPWAFGGNYPWWKYMNRPVPAISELDEIKKRTFNADALAYEVDFRKTIKFLNNSTENTRINAVSHDYYKVKTFDVQYGRYFTENESASGRNVIILGNTIAEALFGPIDPTGKFVKIAGRKLMVIGVFKKEGDSILGNSLDETALIPVNFARNFIDLRSENFDPLIMVKASNGITNDQLKDELTGAMRAVRKLKPMADDNFALNETSLLSQGFDSIFSVVGLAGWIIGGFSILVGGFGIANIMFVSVRERTSMIGIQKSLGAKNIFILMQFLFESVVLSLIGGAVGLLIVFIGTVLANSGLDLDITLSVKNIILGLTVSGIIGVVSGFVPAYTASRLSPVNAIRSV